MTSRSSKKHVLSMNNDDNIAPLSKKNKKHSKKSIEKAIIPQNIFTRFLSDAGVVFDVKGNKLETDPVTFWKKLDKIILTRNDNVEETKESLITALDKSIENEQFFVSCLMPTELSVSLEDLSFTSSQISSSIQDSILKILMRSNHMQSIVINALIKKLPLYIETDSVKVDPCFGIGESCGADIVNMPRLILNQMRWLDVIEDASTYASQLLEISSVMRSEIACDIIAFIPDLLPDDCNHETIALKLCDLLSDGPENITSAVFDALSNFNLSQEVQKKVYELALSYLSTASVQDIAVIIKYLLRSCESSDAAKQVIEILHPHLDFSVLIASSSDDNLEAIKTSTSIIADIMYSSMQFHTYIGAAWISFLEKTPSIRINVGDVISLLLLCDVSNTSQKKTAVNLLHSKLKRGLLPNKILRKTVQVCPHILSSRFSSIRRLTQSLLWHSDSSLKHSAAILYEEFLLNLDSFCKQECIGMLVEHISSLTSGKNSETSIALDVLCSVSRSHPSVLTPYANFLRDGLDHMDVMTLEQVRKSYQILSRLAFSSADTLTSGMKDDMHMILQKQLTHVSDRYKHVGIIGTVLMLVAMSKAPNSSEKIEEVDKLFDLLHYVLRNDIKGWSLYFDEIFLTLQGNDEIPKFLLKKLNDEAQSKLQEKFLRDYDGTQPAVSSGSDQIACTYRFGLLSEDEQKETDLGIALTPLLLSTHNRYVTTLLCSLFRAISSLERKLTGTLDEIDALLCCPIFLHDMIYEERSSFVDLSVEMQMLLLDSLFAILNWFRELISVFCNESDPEVQMNVLVRFKQMCDLQSSIDRLLSSLPDSYIPVVVNSSVADPSSIKAPSATKSTKGLKPGSSFSTSTQKDCKSQNATLLMSRSPLKKSLKAKKDKKSSASSSSEKETILSGSYRPFLRELNRDALLLLKCRLQCENSSHQKLKVDVEADEKFLRPRHLQVLLYDFNDKVKHRLATSKLPFGFGNQAACGVGFEQIDQVPALEVTRFAVSVLPHLCQHLEAISLYFKDQNAKEEMEVDLDESSFSLAVEVHQHERITHCYESLLEILNHVLSWHGLDDEENIKLLQSLLKVFSTRHQSSDDAGLITLLSNSFGYLRSFSSTLPSSHAAYTLIKVLIILYDFADDHKSQQTWMSKQLSDTALEFLQREWNDMETIANSQKRNVIISGLFSTHLKYSSDLLDSIEQFLKNSLSYLLDDPIEREENEESVNYPCLTKANYYLFYKTMIERLGSEATSIPSISKSSSRDVDNVDLLLRWNEVVKVLDLLIRLLKTFPSRLMLGPALKYAKATVESFVRNGIPVCEATFREHQDDVIVLLKKVQTSTRQLQHAACHSKIAKDTALTNHVPALKRCLENFVFRVKAMLVLHDCEDAFWLGNLKNRNLQGEELLSQISTSSSPDREEPNLDASESSYSESY